MKHYLLSLFALLFLAALFLDASGGPGAVQNADRTGSPLTSGTCANCHAGNSYNPSVQVQILDGDTPVSAYTPGQEYTLRVSVSATGDPRAFGFQTVALSGEDNTTAGVFGEAPAGTQISIVNGRNYFEHSERSTESSWSIPWTAPEAGAGEVRLYASAVAVNRNNLSSGDSPVSMTAPLTLAENAVSSAFAPPPLDLRLTAFPNPVKDVLNLELSGAEQGRLQLQLFNNQGQLLLQNAIERNTGNSLHQLNVASLAAGQYRLFVTDGERGTSIAIMKN